MNRILSAVFAFGLTASLATGAAFAKPHNAHGMANGSAMNGMAMSHHSMSTHHNHRYGNDKARCRDAKGRFLKRTDARCLAR